MSEVLARKRPLSLAMIRKVHKGLGIPADILLGDTDDDVDIGRDPQYDYSKFPWQEMLERGYIHGVDTARKAKERGEELMRQFLRDLSSASQSQALYRAPLHQNGSRMMDEYALMIGVFPTYTLAGHVRAYDAIRPEMIDRTLPEPAYAIPQNMLF